MGNAAGLARAQAEQAYAEQLLWEGQHCFDLATDVEKRAEAHDWPWLRAQMWLERSNCANQINDMGTYELALNRGVEEAARSLFDRLVVARRRLPGCGGGLLRGFL